MFELFGFAVAFVLSLISTFVVFVGLRFGGLDCGPMKWYWWIIGVSVISCLWMKLVEYSPFSVVIN